MKGNPEVEFIWWDEPGGNRWRLKRKNDQHQKIRITVSEFSSSYGDSITGDEVIAEFEIQISHFFALVYFQMKKISTLLTEKSFERNRSGCFPSTEFRKLESLFKAYNETNKLI